MTAATDRAAGVGERRDAIAIAAVIVAAVDWAVTGV
jgi:hypothetical protein